jgi:aminopeptidase N
MKKILLAFVFLATIISASAQDSQDDATTDTAWKHIYRGTYPRINDLVNTKLAVNFDFDKQWMNGEEWVTLQPHFYPTDSLTLDAKGMDIKEISLIKGNKKIPLKYAYDSMQLRITLDKTYKGGEKYSLYLKYISKPNDLKLPGSAAITDAKRWYFINPK